MAATGKIGAQIYGYTVCLVSVITLLIAVTMLVTSLFNLQDPLHSEGWTPAGSPSLASFENYKMDLLKNAPKSDNGTQASFLPGDSTLRLMYLAAREDKIQHVKHFAGSNIIVGGLLLLICAILFITHWRWMGRIRRLEP